jgi:hypothetical protein
MNIYASKQGRKVGSKSTAYHPQLYSSSPHQESFCDRNNHGIAHVYSVGRRSKLSAALVASADDHRYECCLHACKQEIHI